MAKSKPQPTSIQRDEHWFRLPVGAPVHEYVVPYGNALLAIEAAAHRKNLAHERMYRGAALQQQRAALAFLDRGGYGIARLNVIKAICDTFSSRLAKDRPMPGIVTTDSTWKVKRRGQKFGEFIRGQMLETEFDDLSRFALDDGTQLGFGFTRIDDNDDAIFAERIQANELLFDRRECKYGKPLQGIRVQRVARGQLAEMFPDDAEWILNHAPESVRRPDDSDVDSNGIHYGDLSDYVDTWEAWHPQTLRDSEDGRHALCIDGKTLVSERWHEPRFPWAQFQLTRPPRGIYPDGFAYQLADIQDRINRIVRDIQMNLSATGRGFFFVNEANDIPVDQMTGFQPFKFKFKGKEPPKWEAPQPFNVAQMQALDKFIDWAFRLMGVSQANAESRSALGPGASGVALDTQYDIDSERFRQPQANYARYRLHSAQAYIDASARVARRREEQKGKKRSWTAVSWTGRDAIQQLDYTKVELKDGDYRLRIEPVGFLPDTQAGKLSAVEQMAHAGVIPIWMVPHLMLDYPDLSEAQRILLAPYKNCLRKMDLLTEEDKPSPIPEQYNDLDLELKISTAYYNWAQAEEAPPEIESRFRDYVDLVVFEIQKRDAGKASAAAPNPGMAAAQGIPPGGPPPPPLAPQGPLPGGIPMMPGGPVPPPIPIGAVQPGKAA
jgi:hypothetical protein